MPARRSPAAIPSARQGDATGRMVDRLRADAPREPADEPALDRAPRLGMGRVDPHPRLAPHRPFDATRPRTPGSSAPAGDGVAPPIGAPGGGVGVRLGIRRRATVSRPPLAPRRGA